MCILPPVTFGFLATVPSVACLSESFGEVEKKITFPLVRWRPSHCVTPGNLDLDYQCTVITLRLIQLSSRSSPHLKNPSSDLILLLCS